MSKRGKYIVIEGADGTGKSTQVSLLQQYLAEEHNITSIQVHEPDGYAGSLELGIKPVAGATELRKIIKDGTIKRDPRTNVMLFTAARRLNWLQAMRPALERGIWVTAARSYLSTVVYQGYGEGEDVERIIKLHKENVSEDYMSPDLELILALEDEEARSRRIDGRGKIEKPDTFESKPESFQRAMQGGYHRLARERGIPILDASRTIEEIQSEIRSYVDKLLTDKDTPQA